MLYADFLEKTCRQRPVIFCTNAYEHWLWEDLRYPAREVQRFYTKDELRLGDRTAQQPGDTLAPRRRRLRSAT